MLIIKKVKLSQAFTLMELLVVMAIITMLAGLLVGTGGAARRQARKAKAKSMIASLEIAISMYRTDTAQYPTDDNGLGSQNLYDHLTNTGVYGASAPPATQIAGWYGPYMEFKSDDLMGTTPDEIKDPWGNPYKYDNSSPPPLNNTNSFDLWSDGEDETSGTTDDVTNW